MKEIGSPKTEKIEPFVSVLRKTWTQIKNILTFCPLAHYQPTKTKNRLHLRPSKMFEGHKNPKNKVSVRANHYKMLNPLLFG